VTDVVGMGRPVYFLFREEGPVVDVFDGLDCLLDLVGMPGVVVAASVILLDALNGNDRIIARFIRGIEHFYGTLVNVGDLRAYQSARHGFIHRNFRWLEVMGHTVMTRGAFHLFQLALIEGRRIKP
jgi:hypothetical protein